MAKWQQLKSIAGYLLFLLLYISDWVCRGIVLFSQCFTNQMPWPLPTILIAQGIFAGYLFLLPFIFTIFFLRHYRAGGDVQMDKHSLSVKFVIGATLTLVFLACFSLVISCINTIAPGVFGNDFYYAYLMPSGGINALVIIIAIAIIGLVGWGIWRGNPISYVGVILILLGIFFSHITRILAALNDLDSLVLVIVFTVLSVLSAVLLFSLFKKEAIAFFFPTSDAPPETSGNDAIALTLLGTFKRICLYCAPLLVFLFIYNMSGIFCGLGFMPIVDFMANDEGWDVSPWALYWIINGVLCVLTVPVMLGLTRLYRYGARKYFDKPHWILKLMLGCILAVVIFLAMYLIVYSFIPKQDRTEVHVLNPTMLPPDESDNIDIKEDSSSEDIRTKMDYYIQSQIPAEAIKVGKKALHKDWTAEEKGELLFKLGLAYLEEGINRYRENDDTEYFKKSIEYSKQAVDILPHKWQAVANIGAAYSNMQDYKNAYVFMDKASQLAGPDNPSYLSLSGQKEFYFRMANSSKQPTLKSKNNRKTDGKLSQEPKGLVLSGIMSGDKPVAIINDAVFPVGETVDGYRIIEINSTSVILEDAKGTKHELLLGR